MGTRRLPRPPPSNPCSPTPALQPQITVNNQMVVGTLMNICDNPKQVSIGQVSGQSCAAAVHSACAAAAAAAAAATPLLQILLSCCCRGRCCRHRYRHRC